MKTPKSDRESMFFFAASGLFAFAAFLPLLLHRRLLHLSNLRVAYGVHHLPAALFSVCCFLLVLAVLWKRLPFWRSPENKSTGWCVSVIVVLFCIFWLPLVLAGGFVQDDWMLLSAAAIRKIVSVHPSLGWVSLDTVDGNFRPLGTVLYPIFMLKVAGLHPMAFLTTNFFANLASSLVVFFIVRTLRYSNVAATVASLLYLSRDVLYTENAWFSALGDALSILFCGLAVLATLRAVRSAAGTAVVLNVLAFLCFCIALLSKQSAFAAALIVPMIFFLRPGEEQDVPLARRVGTGIPALLLYGGAAFVVFLHAKSLLGARTPYQLSLSFAVVKAFFEYLFWYFAALSAPNAGTLLLLLPLFAGIVIFIILALLIRRYPQFVPRRRNDLWFTLGAAVVSLGIVLPLAPRVAAYYSSMFAFWFSIVLALCLASSGLLDLPGRQTPNGRRAAFALSILVALGFTDVRVMQTALIPSGGYIWGTYGMDQNASAYREISGLLSSSPQTRTLVLTDFTGNTRQYACMALLADPNLSRIVTFDSKAQTFLANDRDGARPEDSLQGLDDPNAYNWNVPVPAAEAKQLLSQHSAELWLTMRGNTIAAVTPLDAASASPQ